MEDNKVIELYNRIYNFLESLSLKEKQVSLKELMDDKYVDFKTNLLNNIKVLCHDDREFLINEGYFKYGFYCGSNFSFKWGIINTVNSLKTFSKDNESTLTYHNLARYIDYVHSLKETRESYQRLKIENNKAIEYIDNIFGNEINTNLMKNFEIYIKLLKRFDYLDKRYIFIRGILTLVLSYIYINKSDIDFMEIYQKIDIDEVFEYLYLNGLVLKDDSSNYYINSKYNKEEAINVMYQYIIDTVFNKDKLLVKGSK